MRNGKTLLLSLLIWIICFSAIVAGIVLTYQWYKNRGPQITISFAEAGGIVPNQTPIVFRGVYVGWVKNIVIDEKNERVLVIARMTHQAKDLMGEGTDFWIVKPEFSLSHSSNLNTIATGDYIAMRPKPGKFSAKYIGLDVPPIDFRLTEALEINLRTVDAGGISIGSPILYKGLQIGEIGTMGVTEDKTRVLLKTYIYKEYVDLVRTSTFFGNVSGFHASIHIFGASEIGMDSLKTLLSGGVVMVTPNLGSEQAKAGANYNMLTADQMQQVMSN